MAYGKGKPRQKTQGRKTLEINQSMVNDMEAIGIVTGSSEARSRQGGILSQSLPGRGACSRIMCWADHLPGIHGGHPGLATAEELETPLPPEFLSELQVVSAKARAGYADAPPPLGEGTYLYLREQWADGLVRDTYCRLPSGEGSADVSSGDVHPLDRKADSVAFRGRIS